MAPLGLVGTLPTRTFRVGSALRRAHRNDRGALFFGPAGPAPVHRFDAPDGSFKVCDLGLDEAAAFVEGVLHQPVPTGFVTEAMLAERSIASVHVLEPIRLLRLHGKRLVRLGADASVIHGPTERYAVSQAWARAIHDHPKMLDGILYTSRHDDSTYSIALFDRAAGKVEAGESTPLGPADARTLRLLDRYRIGLVR